MTSVASATVVVWRADDDVVDAEIVDEDETK